MTILADLVHICLFLFLLLVLFLGSCRDCSGICVVLFLEGKRLLLPLDVETDLGRTSIDDSSRGVQEWLPLGIMLMLEPKSQSASRKSTMPMEIGMTGHPRLSLLTGRRSVITSTTGLLQ